MNNTIRDPKPPRGKRTCKDCGTTRPKVAFGGLRFMLDFDEKWICADGRTCVARQEARRRFIAANLAETP